MLTDSPIEFFFDCVGIVLIVAFSWNVDADICNIIAQLREGHGG